MSMTITVQDLFLTILFLLAVTVSILLIITLKNLNTVVNQVKKVIEANESAVNKTISHLPKIAENVSEVSDNIKLSVDNMNSITTNTKDSIEKISDTVDDIMDTVAAAKESTHDIATYIKIGSEIIKAIKGFISDDEKK